MMMMIVVVVVVVSVLPCISVGASMVTAVSRQCTHTTLTVLIVVWSIECSVTSPAYLLLHTPCNCK